MTQAQTSGGLFVDFWTLTLGEVFYIPRPNARERLRTMAARAGVFLAFAVAMVLAAVVMPAASVPAGLALILGMLAAQVRLVPSMVLRFHEKGIAGRFRSEGRLGLIVSPRVIPYEVMSRLELRDGTLVVEMVHPKSGRRSRATAWVAPSQRERVAHLVAIARREWRLE